MAISTTSKRDLEANGNGESKPGESKGGSQRKQNKKKRSFGMGRCLCAVILLNIIVPLFVVVSWSVNRPSTVPVPEKILQTRASNFRQPIQDIVQSVDEQVSAERAQMRSKSGDKPRRRSREAKRLAIIEKREAGKEGLWEKSHGMDPELLEPDEDGCIVHPLQYGPINNVYSCEDFERIDEHRGEKLGSGYFRDVYKVNYEGHEMVWKKLRKQQKHSHRNRERHAWEAAALSHLQGHPNIVQMLGLCKYDMLTEYMPVFLENIVYDDAIELPLSAVLQISLDLANGIKAMHNAEGGPMVHTDIKPSQMLFDRDGVAKVNDLNRMRFMRHHVDGGSCPFYIKTNNGIWRSPEEYAGGDLTEKLDIYSLSLVFYTLVAREEPFSDLDEDADSSDDGYYKTVVLHGGRPHLDPEWDQDYVDLMTDMWGDWPEGRPSATEIVDRLE
ncbi:unnamed protein product, partial [Chrysoparadoxa australica]